MPIDVTAVGRRTEPFVRSWTGADALLYALGVGAGSADPLQELAFTTENTVGVAQQVVPTFGIPVVQTGLGAMLPYGTFERSRLVHAEQAIVVHRPLTPDGSLSVTAQIVSIADKGSGALVHIETQAVDASSGAPVLMTRLGYFIRGEGGFGAAGERTTQPVGPAWRDPDTDPDHVVEIPTRADQALLYRLSGDRNPLHSDPSVATRAGFPRPILHGLATYGIAARVLLGALGDGDPARFRGMSARFTQPVLPGDTLTLQAWTDGADTRFRLRNAAGKTVLDRGTFAVTN